MKIVIRADGGKKIGLGHIMRTLVLAKQLKSFSEVCYVCSGEENFKEGVQYIKQQGYAVVMISKDKCELKDIQADCLITDSYDVDEQYFSEMAKIFSVTGYIDDLNRHYFDVDFILNQNPYATELRYKTAHNTKLFLGLSYVLLRDEFRAIKHRSISAKISDIMITMGGADPYGYTTRIIRQISTQFPTVRLHVVIGAFFEHIAEIEAMKDEHVIIYKSPKMSELMQKCDLAISACGGTVYELAACGVPTIGIPIVDNQKMTAHKMNALGVIKKVDIDGVGNAIKDLHYQARIKMAQCQKQLIDGQGSQRMASEIQQIIQTIS